MSSKTSDSTEVEEQWSKKEERAAVRKLDCYLMPLLVAGFFVLQLDRSNISNAMTDTLTEDLKITKNDVSVGSQLMSAGIVIAEIPSNLILQRLGAPVWLTFQMGVWGTIALTQAWSTNIHSFLSTRFLLGVWEGGYIPDGQYMLALFYPREELALRTAIFYFGNYSATAIGSLMAAGILNMSGEMGQSGRRWLFIVEGAITLAVFLAFIIFLPRSPSHTSPIHARFDFFTLRQRQILRARILADDGTKGAEKAYITLKSLVEALKDFRLWAHMLLNLVALSPKGGLQLYGPNIIKSLGFSRTNANLLNAVSSVLVIILSWLISFASDKSRLRGPWCVVAFSWSMISAGVLYGLPSTSDKWAQYAVFTLLSGGNALAQGLNDAWVSINAPNPSKRSIGLAMAVKGSNLGAIAENLRPGLSAGDSITATNNLPVDQAALLLEMIGTQQGLELQLGIITPTFRRVIYPRDGATTIWVFNNDVTAQSPGLMNHYEGVELLVPTAEELEVRHSRSQRFSEVSREDSVNMQDAFDVLMNAERTVSSAPRKLRQRRHQEPAIAPVSVLDLLKKHAVTHQVSNKSSPRTIPSSRSFQTPGRPSAGRRRAGRRRAGRRPAKSGWGDTDYKDLWTSIMSNFQDEGVAAPSDEEMLSSVAECLRPRLEPAERYRPLSQFETSLAKILRVLFTPENRLISVFNHRLVATDQADDWARVIARHVPIPVQSAFTSGTPNISQIPWIETNDMGVYWIGLRPLMDDEEWYDYVGSATRNGLTYRHDNRYLPSYLQNEVSGIFNKVRFHRRKRFLSHLRETESPQDLSELDDLAWATLMVIPGSEDLVDPRDRIYSRWTSIIAEAAFHLWLGSISSPSATASQCSPWRASGATDDINRKSRERYRANKDRYEPRRQEYRDANRDKINRRKRELYAAKRDEINRQESELRAANIDAINRRRREYRAANRDEINRRRRELRAANRDETNRRQRLYYKKNKKQ